MMENNNLSVGQILYYVDWKKYPTIHECKIIDLTPNQKGVKIQINLDICKAFGGGAFQQSHTLGRKFFTCEQKARNAVQDHMYKIMEESLKSHQTVLKKYIASQTQTIKPLK